MVFNGDGNGGGVWIDTLVHFPVDSNYQSTQWLRLTVYHNYFDHTWNLYTNGLPYGGSANPTNLGMVSSMAMAFTSINWSGTGTNGSAYFDKLSVSTSAPFTAPTIPASITVTGKTPTTVSLSWAASTDQNGPGVYAYQIEYYTGGAIYFSNYFYGTSGTLTGLSSGATYNFQVRAINLSLVWSELSSSVSATTPIPVNFAANPTNFTYNGSGQGPTVTPTPAGATYSVTGTATATGAGSYSFTLTGTGSYYGTNTIPWTISPATPSVSISPTTKAVLINSSASFTASGGPNGYVWAVSPSGPTGISGSGASQTVTFSSRGTYTISVYSPSGGNYNQSNTATAIVTAAPPTQPDTSNQTQLNIHLPFTP